MNKQLKIDLLITVILIILGQLIFFILSPRFLTVSYSNSIYATIATTSEEEKNPQSLAEAGKQFGETMIGWMKFPSFMNELKAVVSLPEGSGIGAHPQERQNIVITLSTPQPIEKETLVAVKDYLESKIETYNTETQNNFLLTQLDYEQVKLEKSYKFGAGVTLIITLILSAGVWYLRREIRS